MLTTESRFSGDAGNRVSFNNKQVYNPVVSKYVQSMPTEQRELFLDAIALGDEKKASMLHEETPTGSKAFQQFFAAAFPTVLYIGVAKDDRQYTAEEFIIARLLPRKVTDKIRMKFEAAKVFTFPPQRHAEGTRVYNQAYAFESTELELVRWEYGANWWYEAQFESIDSFHNFIEATEEAHRLGLLYLHITQAMQALLRAPYMQELRTQVLRIPRPVSLKEAFNIESRTFGILNGDLPWGIARFYQYVNNLLYEQLELVPRAFDTVMFPQGTNHLQVFGGPTGDTRNAQFYFDAAHSGTSRAHSMLKNGASQVIPVQLPKGVEWGEWKIPNVSNPTPGMKNPLTLNSRTGAFFVWDLQSTGLTDAFIARRGTIRTYSREENGIASFDYLDAIWHMAIFDSETGDYSPFLHRYLNKYAETGWPIEAYHDETGNINQYIQRIDRENAIRTHDPKYYDLIRRVGDRESQFQSYDYDRLHAETGSQRLVQLLTARGITIELVQRYLQLLKSMVDIPYNEATKNYLKAIRLNTRSTDAFVVPDRAAGYNVATLPEWNEDEDVEFPTIAYGYAHQPGLAYLYELFTSGKDRKWHKNAPKFYDDVVELYPIGKELFLQAFGIWIESDLWSARLLPAFLHTGNDAMDAITSMIIFGLGIPLTPLWIQAAGNGATLDERTRNQNHTTHYVSGLLAGANVVEDREPNLYPLGEPQVRPAWDEFERKVGQIKEQDALRTLPSSEEWDTELVSFFIWTDFADTVVADLFPRDTIRIQSILRSARDNSVAAKTIRRWTQDHYQTTRAYGDLYRGTSENALHKEFIYMFAREFVLPWATSDERDRMRVALAIMFFTLLCGLDDIDKSLVGPTTRMTGRTHDFYSNRRHLRLNQLPTVGLPTVAATLDPGSAYVHTRLLINKRFLAQTYNMNDENREEAFMLPDDRNHAFAPILKGDKLREWIGKVLKKSMPKWKHVLFANVEAANRNDDDDDNASQIYGTADMRSSSRKRKPIQGLTDDAPFITIYRNGDPNRNMRERITELLKSTHSNPLQTLCGMAWLMSAVNARTLQSHYNHGLPVFEPTVIGGWPIIELITDSTVFGLADQDPKSSGFNSTGGVYVYVSHLTRDWENQNISQVATQTRLFMGGHVAVPNNIVIWPASMIRGYNRGWGREPIDPCDDADGGFFWDLQTNRVSVTGDMLFMACGPSVRRHELMRKAISLSSRKVHVQRAPGVYDSYDHDDDEEIQPAFPMQHFYSTLYDFASLHEDPPDFTTFEDIQKFKTITPMLPISHDFPVSSMPNQAYDRAHGWSLFDDVPLEEIHAKLTRFE